MQDFSEKNFSEIDASMSRAFTILTAVCGIIFCSVIFLLHFRFEVDGSVTLCAIGTIYSLIAILLYEQIAQIMIQKLISYPRLALIITAKAAILVVLFLSLRTATPLDIASTVAGILSFIPAAIVIGLVRSRRST